MTTKRQILDSFRSRLNEKQADSNYSNYFLYNTLMDNAKWLIKRDISAGRIYSNPSLFQTLTSLEIIETSTIDACCPIKTKCKIYRTKNMLPDMWIDNDGPVIRKITSVDGSFEFFRTTATTWQNKKEDPYQKFSPTKYAFFANGYLWIPEVNPHYINVDAYFVDDVRLLKDDCSDCTNKECLRFLDSKFMVPDWLHAEMFSKALEQVAGITKKLPEDLQIDKNANRKN